MAETPLFLRKLLVFLFLTGFVVQAWAGGSARREQIIAQYQTCEWTDEMGKELYQCIVDNNGFSTLFCFNTTVENSCEKDTVLHGGAVTVVAQKDDHQSVDPARMGEENVTLVNERERKMHPLRDCPFTEEMSQFVYECVMLNDGVGAHGCFDRSKEVFCETE